MSDFDLCFQGYCIGLKGLAVRSSAIVILPLMINQVTSLRCGGVSLTVIFSGSREGEVFAIDEDPATYVCAVC